MDYESYKKAYFTEPPPQPKFNFIGLHGVALYFSDYAAAVDYYTAVLGPPSYVEGESTRGWSVGGAWLTLFPSQTGNPQNAEIHFLMGNPQEAERLQRAFIAAGGKGDPPSDQLMYEPLRFCPVTDPFGTSILIVGRLPE
ncbi:MAG: hypothetical protein HND47_14600 [Chloroflexi bacterium]|nr:hypothetical protein [Chloroflexota bacterium]